VFPALLCDEITKANSLVVLVFREMPNPSLGGQKVTSGYPSQEDQGGTSGVDARTGSHIFVSRQCGQVSIKSITLPSSANMYPWWMD
jgi:hypothetical protein